MAFSAVLMLCCASAPACAAPSQLLNKTIQISYTSNIPAADGLAYPSRANAITIYVSSLGRVFMKRTSRAGRFGEDQQAVGGNFAFVGARLIGTRRFGNGASQLTISFDNNFQTCSVQIVVGSEQNKQLEWTSLNGIKRSSSGRATVSNQACSIENGNAFAR